MWSAHVFSGFTSQEGTVSLKGLTYMPGLLMDTPVALGFSVRTVNKQDPWMGGDS